MTAPASSPADKASEWANRPVDIDFLIDSGLLFEINREVLHPLGVRMVVRVDAQGNKTWAFKDLRDTPEAQVFDKGTLELGRRKFVRFMHAYGSRQLKRRTKKIGQAVEPVCPSWQ